MTKLNTKQVNFYKNYKYLKKLITAMLGEFPEAFKLNIDYREGEFVIENEIIYKAKNEVLNATLNPASDTTNWVKVDVFNNSSTISHTKDPAQEGEVYEGDFQQDADTIKEALDNITVNSKFYVDAIKSFIDSDISDAESNIAWNLGLINTNKTDINDKVDALNSEDIAHTPVSNNYQSGTTNTKDAIESIDSGVKSEIDGLNLKLAWDSSENYTQNDVSIYDGVIYRSRGSNLNKLPEDNINDWALYGGTKEHFLTTEESNVTINLDILAEGNYLFKKVDNGSGKIVFSGTTRNTIDSRAVNDWKLDGVNTSIEFAVIGNNVYTTKDTIIKKTSDAWNTYIKFSNQKTEQYGWFYVAANGSNVSKEIGVLPTGIDFSKIKSGVVNYIGFKNGSDPTSSSDIGDSSPQYVTGTSCRFSGTSFYAVLTSTLTATYRLLFFINIKGEW